MKKPDSLVPLFFCLTFLAFAGCTLVPIDEYSITATSPVIKLEWDPPPNIFSAPQLAISGFSVYIRTHGTEQWRLIGSVSASENPSIALNHADYGNGWYDFAVSVIYGTRGQSEMHSSLDATSRPLGGWFLKWDYSEGSSN
jgi:hypothetical protein